mgnify:CR=1 FL=1
MLQANEVNNIPVKNTLDPFITSWTTSRCSGLRVVASRAASIFLFLFSRAASARVFPFDVKYVNRDPFLKLLCGMVPKLLEGPTVCNKPCPRKCPTRSLHRFRFAHPSFLSIFLFASSFAVVLIELTFSPFLRHTNLRHDSTINAVQRRKSTKTRASRARTCTHGYRSRHADTQTPQRQVGEVKWCAS